MTDSDRILKRKPEIFDFPFDSALPKKLCDTAYGENWPVVYILNNDKEAYIGETSNTSSRMSEHWNGKQSKKRKS